MADATYKIIIEGFPLLTVGTTDECRVFHPFGFAIVLRERASDFEFLFNSVKKGASILGIEYNPTTIIADNAPSIENGFNKSFKKCEKRVNCWAHTIRNIDDELN